MHWYILGLVILVGILIYMIMTGDPKPPSRKNDFLMDEYFPMDPDLGGDITDEDL